MLLLFESNTSWAKVLAWLPDAPPNMVPFGNVTVCGFCSSGRCTENCRGGGCGAHPRSPAVAMITPKMPIILLFIYLLFLSYLLFRICYSASRTHIPHRISSYSILSLSHVSKV